MNQNILTTENKGKINAFAKGTCCMYVSECFWPKDLSFDRSRQKSQIVKSALRCFPIVLRLGTTPTTGAADNPLNIYPDISSAVAAAHLSNLSIINIIIIIAIIVNIILIETRNLGIVGTEVHHPSTPAFCEANKVADFPAVFFYLCHRTTNEKPSKEIS